MKTILTPLIFISLVAINNAEYTTIAQVKWDVVPSAMVGGIPVAIMALPDDFLPVRVLADGTTQQLTVEYFCQKACQYVYRGYEGHNMYGTFRRKHFTSSQYESITALECKGSPANVFVRKIDHKYFVYVLITGGDPLQTQAAQEPVLT